MRSIDVALGPNAISQLRECFECGLSLSKRILETVSLETISRLTLPL